MDPLDIHVKNAYRSVDLPSILVCIVRPLVGVVDSSGFFPSLSSAGRAIAGTIRKKSPMCARVASPKVGASGS